MMSLYSQQGEGIDWIVIGRFGRPQGIQGFIRVHSYTDPSDNILDYPWYANVNKTGPRQLLNVLDAKIHNQSTVLAKISGYESREQVALLTNIVIATKREVLPLLQPGEYYWHELIGMEVINQHEQQLGIVQDILSTGANDVLVVAGNKRYLIPYVSGNFISNIDPKQRKITVVWEIDD